MKGPYKKVCTMILKHSIMYHIFVIIDYARDSMNLVNSNQSSVLTIIQNHLGEINGRLKNWHPAMLLAEVATDEDEDIKLRVDCAKTLMPYIEASRKSIDVRANINSDTGLLRVSLFENNYIDGANVKQIGSDEVFDIDLIPDPTPLLEEDIDIMD